MGIQKRQLQMSLDSTMDRSIYDEIKTLPLVHLAEDAREAIAIAAYREKREVNYTGR